MTNGSEYQFCRKNFLSQQTLSNIEDLKGQLVVSLVDSGFLPLTEVERTMLNKYITLTYSWIIQYADSIGRGTLVEDDNSLIFLTEPMLTATTTP